MSDQWSAPVGGVRTNATWDRGRSRRPDDSLELGVGLEAVVAAVAADTGELEPAERRLVVALHGVHADLAGPDLLGDGEGPGRVTAVDVAVEAEVAVVGDA